MPAITLRPVEPTTRTLQPFLTPGEAAEDGRRSFRTTGPTSGLTEGVGVALVTFARYPLVIR